MYTKLEDGPATYKVDCEISTNVAVIMHIALLN